MVISALLYNTFPHFAKAASTFKAGWDGDTDAIFHSEFWADTAKGSRIATNNGATQSTPGMSESSGGALQSGGKALKIGPKQGIRYDTKGNIDLSRSQIESNFKLDYSLSGSDVTAYQFNNSGQIAVDTSISGQTVVYVADTGSNRIARMVWNGSSWEQWSTFGQFGSGVGQFNNPTSIAFDAHNQVAYIGDSGNCRVIRLHWNGSGWDSWYDYGICGSNQEQFYTSGYSTFSSFALDTSDEDNPTLVLADFGRIIRITWDSESNDWSGWNEVIDGDTVKLGTIKGLAYNQSSKILYFVNSIMLEGDGGASYYLSTAHWNGTGWENWWHQSDQGGYNPSPDNKSAQVTLDSANSLLYASDSANIYKFSLSTPAQPSLTSSFQNFGGSSSNFSKLKGIAYNPADTSLYSVDTGLNSSIVRATRTGASTWSSTSYGGNNTIATTFTPVDVAYDTESNTTFAVEATRIVALHTTGGMIDRWYNYNGTAADPLSRIVRASYDPTTDSLYVMDFTANGIQIKRLPWNGSAFGAAYSYTASGISWTDPSYVTGFSFDPTSQCLFITLNYYTDGSGNSQNLALIKIAYSGGVLSATPDVKNGFYSSTPGPVAFDGANHKIFYVDGSNIKAMSWSGSDGNIVLDTTASHISTYPLSGAASYTNIVYNASESALYGIDPGNFHIIRSAWTGSGFAASTTYGERGAIDNYGGGRVKEGLFNGLVGIALGPNGDVYVGDGPNHRVVKVTWVTDQFTNWTTFADPWHYLMATTGQKPLRIRLNILTSRLEFYLSSGGNEVFAQTEPVTLSASTWYKYQIKYDSTAGQYSVTIYDYTGSGSTAKVLAAKTVSGATWAAPTSLGANFYLGSDTNPNYDQRSLGGYLDNFSIASLAPPPAPTNLGVSPTGYSKVNSYTFTWTPPTSDLFGYDDLTGYEYNIGDPNIDEEWVSFDDPNPTNKTENKTLTLENAARRTGTNHFYLRSKGIHGPSSYISVPFYYSNTAPSKPANFSVDKSSSDTNSFGFSWGVPQTFEGDSNGSGIYYHYVVNAYPNSTGSNVSTTMGRSLTAGPYATRQGDNYMYIVAEDSAGNVDYNSCRNTFGSDPLNPSGADKDSHSEYKCDYVKFNAQTTAPGIPLNLQAKDISERDTADYEVVLKWQAPAAVANANVSGYQVYRANGTEDANKNVTCPSEWDDSAFTAIPGAAPSDTNYIDTGLQSKPYCYAVKARDNALQYGMPVMMVQGIHPAGIYKSPPTITDGPHVEVGALSTVITWTTDRESSSLVKYGVNEKVLGMEVGRSDVYTVNHSVTIKTDSATTYYYNASSLDRPDDGGKRITSKTESFTSKELPYFSEVEIPENNVTLNSAVITYKTSQPATTTIMYAANPEFAENKILDDKSGYTSEHTVNLTNLSHSTKYYFKISGIDIHGDPLNASIVQSFSTLTMPMIDGNVTSDQDKEAPTTTYRFSWKTNIKTSSVIYYTNSAGQKASASSPDMTTDHTLTIPNLADKSIYTFEVTGVDEHGLTVGNAYKTQIETPQDTRPPKISNLTVEVKSSGFGTSQKAQIVVTWQTDEPGTSQVEYDQGISGDSYANKSKTDQTLSTSHAVILADLEPSRIYHLRAISSDQSGNVGQSEDTTTITGKMQNSVLDIIMNSLQSSLGWIFGIFNR